MSDQSNSQTRTFVQNPVQNRDVDTQNLQTKNANRLDKAFLLAEQNQAKIMQEMQLIYPPDLDEDQKNYWDRYFNVLIEGYLEGVVFLEDIKAFEENFWNIPDNQKDGYIDAFDLMIYKHIKGKYQTLGIIKGAKLGDNIDSLKQELPEEYRTLFEYVAYSLASGQSIDPEVQEFLQDLGKNQLSEEEIDQIHQYNLSKKLLDTRRRGLRADELEGAETAPQRKFNKALTPDQLSDYLENQDKLADLKLEHQQADLDKARKITLEELEQKELEKLPKPEIRTIRKNSSKNNPQTQNPSISNLQFTNSNPNFNSTLNFNRNQNSAMRTNQVPINNSNSINNFGNPRNPNTQNPGQNPSTNFNRPIPQNNQNIRPSFHPNLPRQQMQAPRPQIPQNSPNTKFVHAQNANQFGNQNINSNNLNRNQNLAQNPNQTKGDFAQDASKRNKGLTDLLG